MLLGCKKGDKYRSYKTNLELSVTKTKKYDCSFKLCEKLIHNGLRWIMKVICGNHNHEQVKTLVCHP